MIGIYKITNKINGKAYIGQSNHIKRRWSEHKRNIGSNKNPMYLAFQKYGIDNFIFEILEECSVQELNKKEIYYISYYNTYIPNGYNLTLGGEGTKQPKNNVFKDLNIFYKDISLKIYTYLVCISGLKDNYSHVRIFQQKDINLAEIKRTFHMDERTIKKYWEMLELEDLIRYNNWKQEDKSLSFNERWKIRNKNKNVYYEIPTPPKFRKIPKETLVEINQQRNIDELTFKIYMTLINYQEACITNGKQYKPFTYEDLRDILDYKKHNDIDKRMETSLNQLQSLGLIDIQKDKMLNKFGVTIPVFVLKQANFYTSFDIKDFEPAAEEVIEEEEKVLILENQNFKK